MSDPTTPENEEHPVPTSDDQPTLALDPTPSAATPAPAPAPPAPYAPVEQRLPARVGTIVWGVLLLGFCAYTGIVVVNGAAPNPIAWLTAALIIGGIALVAVGITAAARKR